MRRLLGALALAAASIALASVGCEALVPKDLPAFACTPANPGACPLGHICSPAGVCVSSCPETPCAADLECDVSTHLCVPTIDIPDSTVPDTAQPDGAVLDSPVDSPVRDTGTDTPATPGELGATCQTTANCNAGLFCGSDSVLGDAVKTTGPLCTRPCCKSEDCPGPDFACYGPGTGGTYCVRASLLMRGSSPGAGKGGVTCTVPEACRSGVCLGIAGSMACTDTCCSDADCAAPSVCRLIKVEGHNVFACAVPGGATGTNDTDCLSGAADCRSGVCAGGGTFGQCKPHCCGKASCGAQSPVYATCAYLQTANVPEFVGLCLHSAENPNGSPGSGIVGSTCDPSHTITSDCKTSFCDAVTLKCTDVCCIDADCAPYAGTKCRPSSNPHYLTCQ